MKNNNIIKTAINWTALTLEKTKNFNEYKFVNVSESEPLKVQYIKQDKINSLKDYQNIIFKNSKKQKNYLDNTSIFKLLNNMFKADTTEQVKKLNDVSDTITKQLIVDSVKDISFFVEYDLKSFYAQEENYKYIVGKNGSCMEKKPKNFFEIYNNFINTNALIVGLRKNNNVIARAILWTKTDKETNAKKYYLDRIYINTQYDNTIKEDLQRQLFFKAKRSFKIKTLDAFNISNIRNLYKDHNEKVKNNLKDMYSYPRFKIQITQDNFESLEKYPYLDSFRFFKYTSNNLISCDEGEGEIQFDQTDGEYNETGNKEFCEYSQDYYDRDLCFYSEIDSCFYYEENCRYVDERSDYVSLDEAVYNDYSGEYHYRQDLEI